MGLKYNHRGLYKRKTRRPKEELGDMTTEARGWSDTRKGSPAKECRKPPEFLKKGKGMDSPLELPEGISPADTLT